MVVEVTVEVVGLLLDPLVLVEAGAVADVLPGDNAGDVVGVTGADVGVTGADVGVTGADVGALGVVVGAT